MFVCKARFAKFFVLFLCINSLFILSSQFFVLPKLFDGYWFYSLFYRESMLFCTYFLVFVLIFYIPFSWLQSFIFYIFTFISLLLFILNIFLIFHFDSTLNPYLLSIALQSDPKEAREFLSVYFDFRVILISLLFLAFFYFVFKKTKALTRGGGIRVFYIFLILLLFVISAHVFKFRPHYERYSDVIYNATLSFNQSLNRILKSMNEYEQISKNFDIFIKDINYTKIDEKDKIDNIVLIIGESTQRNLMQIYGFELEDTPNLVKLKQENPDNLLVFDDVISSQTTTYEALAQVLTFYNQDTKERNWSQFLNVIDAIKLAGYKAINISNQEKFSLWDKASTTIFHRSDKVFYTSMSDYFEQSKPDEVVLPVISRILKEKKQDEKLFLSVHLMGNHAVYYNRYPKEFDRFKKEDLDESIKGRKTIAEYANNTLYGDFVLSSIIDKFKHSDSIVIFLSDHGEEVYDRGEHYLHNDAKISRFMVEIPFIIYVSDEFIKKHEELYKRIKASTNKPFMSDDLIHALIDIAGNDHFKIDGYESKRSLFYEGNFTRQRIVGKTNLKDYDKELKGQKRIY